MTVLIWRNSPSLSYYCADDSINVIPLAFLYVFFGKGGAPVIDFANVSILFLLFFSIIFISVHSFCCQICNQYDNHTFPGTALADCTHMAEDVKICQRKGKIVTLSLGGSDGKVGIGSDSMAKEFAATVWNDFLGGKSTRRPFGDAVLDGCESKLNLFLIAHPFRGLS